jgi:hypothetical protein
MGNCGVLDDPITDLEMPPDVEIPDAELGREALCSYASHEGDKCEQLHDAQLQKPGDLP